MYGVMLDSEIEISSALFDLGNSYQCGSWEMEKLKLKRDNQLLSTLTS
tara:strand:- start:133 stop:276 length:144 start_codon:yes stop_codon:yes gene_type:complete